jgi:trans-aconitate 2-methyltransferase
MQSMPEETIEIFPGEVFADVTEFDSSIRQLLPYYDEMLGAIARCLPTDASRILELGCGTGELSLKVMECCPSAQLVGIDYSPRMITFVRSKIESAGYAHRWRGVEMDFGEWANNQGSEAGTGFDAVVSSLAIHHLSDEMKLKLFGQICQTLNPGGIFWNADPVLPESPQLSEFYQKAREEWCNSHGTTLEDVRSKMGRSETHGYSNHDQLATLDAHLQMLKTAGFESVAVPWKYYGLAVFGGWVDMKSG